MLFLKFINRILLICVINRNADLTMKKETEMKETDWNVNPLYKPEPNFTFEGGEILEFVNPKYTNELISEGIIFDFKGVKYSYTFRINGIAPEEIYKEFGMNDQWRNRIAIPIKGYTKYVRLKKDDPRNIEIRENKLFRKKVEAEF